MIIFDKPTFTEVLVSDATILDLLLHPVERRRLALQNRLAEDGSGRRVEDNDERRDFLSRIGQFLGIVPENGRYAQGR